MTKDTTEELIERLRLSDGLGWEPSRAKDLMKEAAERLAASDEMEKALEFYASPGGKCDQVPDFYSELDFGATADAALSRAREAKGGSDE